ncbi:hypothetical protein VNO78_10567 [Psophocarpus tetragonolobus]|uniref:Uncharacterized protein n=1 Tax=Psophocarpus tetragonolobus TaxID=3891 RepID=A0AAN9XMV0_PSOTE
MGCLSQQLYEVQVIRAPNLRFVLNSVFRAAKSSSNPSKNSFQGEGIDPNRHGEDAEDCSQGVPSSSSSHSSSSNSLP